MKRYGFLNLESKLQGGGWMMMLTAPSSSSSPLLETLNALEDGEKMERKWRDKEDEMDEGRYLGKWEGNGETKKMEWMKELV